jgi:hypothetical protein
MERAIKNTNSKKIQRRFEELTGTTPPTNVDYWNTRAADALGQWNSSAVQVLCLICWTGFFFPLDERKVALRS